MAEDFNSKYSGEQVEQLLDQVASGSVGGGGGGITAETDPIFSASPAASITEGKITEWNSKQNKIADLENIRNGAAKGATALQDIPNDVIRSSEDGTVEFPKGRLVDNNTGLQYALPSSDEDREGADHVIATEEYVDNKVTGGGAKKYVKISVSGTGSIVFRDYAEAGQVVFAPNTVYYADGYVGESINIIDVALPASDVGEYTLHFTTDSPELGFLGNLSVPSNWLWANGSIPTIERGCSYELSVIATKLGEDYIYKAILTPFKAV